LLDDNANRVEKMEWKVVDGIFLTPDNLQILKVTAEGDLKFLIWIKSNLEVPLNCMLTPVIDGYIANHDKGHFVAIQKAVPYSLSEWKAAKMAQHSSHSVHIDGVTSDH
jgi:hypothetical protein